MPNESQQAETPNKVVAGEEGDALGALADLFRTKKPDAEGEAEAEGESSEPARGQQKSARKTKPKNLVQLAETLECKVEELYALEIPSSQAGAQPFTLGKLKDFAAQQDAFTVRTLKFDEDVRRKELELEDAREEVRLITSALPETALKPDVLKKIREIIGKKRETDNARLLELVPEWANEDTMKAERSGMAEHLRSYGLSANFLDTVRDSRIVKYIRENFLRDQRVRKALELVKERNTETPARGRATQQKRGDTQQQSTTSVGGLEESRARGFLNRLRSKEK